MKEYDKSSKNSNSLNKKVKRCQVYARNVFFPKYFSTDKRLSILDLSAPLPDDYRCLKKKLTPYQDTVITCDQAEKKGVWLEGRHVTEKEWIEEIIRQGGPNHGKIFHPFTFLEKLPRETWLEDEKGKKQGTLFQFDYFLGRVPQKTTIEIGGSQLLPPKTTLGIPTLPKQEDVSNGHGIIQYVSKVQTYQDGQLNGPTVYLDKNYREIKFEYYKAGKQNGLAGEKHTRQLHSASDPIIENWEYSYWENGKKIMDDTQTRAYLKSKVDKLKAEKKEDASARATTLKKVLKANTLKQKLRVLSKFHTQKSPAGAQRRVSKTLMKKFKKTVRQ